MPAIDEALDPYRSARDAFGRGATVTEIQPERIFVGPDGRAQADMQARNVNVSRGKPSAQARAFAQSGAGVNPTIRAAQAIESGIGAAAQQEGTLTSLSRRAGRALASPAGRLVGRAAGAAGVVGNFGDYKIDDSSVDSSAGGTLRALGSGDFAGAGRSLSKGALEVGMDIGSAVANTADLVVPGKAPVSTRYGEFLRDKFGGQLVDNTQQPAQTLRATPPISGPLQTIDQPIAGSGRGSVNPNVVNPTGPQLVAGQDIGDGIQRITNGGPGGRAALYTNVADQAPFNASRGGLVSGGSANGPGFDGDGTYSPSIDNQTRAANIRDGVDINRGIGGNVGGVTTLGAGYAEEVARKNVDTAAASLRNDARLASGARQAKLLDQAQAAKDQPNIDAERTQRGDIARLNANTEQQRTRSQETTLRRGQDIGLIEHQAGNQSAQTIETMRGTSARDVATLGADARLAAAEARADGRKGEAKRFTHIAGGQEVRMVNGMPITVKVPDSIFDQQTGQYSDAGAPKAPSTPQATPRAEYDKLPKGARYIGPDGKTYLKD